MKPFAIAMLACLFVGRAPAQDPDAGLAPNTAALTPLTAWPAISSHGPGNTARSTARAGSARTEAGIDARRPS